MLNVSIFNTIVTQLYNYFNSCFLFLRAERQICDDNIVPVYTAIYGSPQAGVFWQASSIWLSEHHLGFKFGSLWSHKEASYSIASRYPHPPNTNIRETTSIYGLIPYIFLFRFIPAPYSFSAASYQDFPLRNRLMIRFDTRSPLQGMHSFTANSAEFLVLCR